MRSDFLSFNDIKKQLPGFKFYNKHGKLFELVSVKIEWVTIASGFLGDMRQKKITLQIIDKQGKRYDVNNFSGRYNDGDIFNIKIIENDWDSLDFKTVESVRRKKRLALEKKISFEKKSRDAYIKYLRGCKEDGRITELEMYKRIDFANKHYEYVVESMSKKKKVSKKV